jgi:ribosome recycling factor
VINNLETAVVAGQGSGVDSVGQLAVIGVQGSGVIAIRPFDHAISPWR